MQKFFDEHGYGIVPVDNPHLKDLEILVLKMYDRSLSKGGSATVHPTDMEIMRMFWSDWLKKSNVKRFELRPIASTVNDVEKVILNFILEDKWINLQSKRVDTFTDAEASQTASAFSLYVLPF